MFCFYEQLHYRISVSDSCSFLPATPLRGCEHLFPLLHWCCWIWHAVFSALTPGPVVFLLWQMGLIRRGTRRSILRRRGRREVGGAGLLHPGTCWAGGEGKVYTALERGGLGVFWMQMARFRLRESSWQLLGRRTCSSVLWHRVSCSCSEGKTGEPQSCLPHKSGHLVGEEMPRVVTVEYRMSTEFLPTCDCPPILSSACVP